VDALRRRAWAQHLCGARPVGRAAGARHGGPDCNGYVCGLVQPDSVRDAFCMIGGGNSCNLAQLGLPIYLFTDDDNPASQ
jgi:hypothetical protein